MVMMVADQRLLVSYLALETVAVTNSKSDPEAITMARTVKTRKMTMTNSFSSTTTITIRAYQENHRSSSGRRLILLPATQVSTPNSTHD